MLKPYDSISSQSPKMKCGIELSGNCDELLFAGTFGHVYLASLHCLGDDL